MTTDSVAYMAPGDLAELIEAADLAELDDNGSTVTLAPGYDLHLVIDSDPDANLDDYDEEFTGRFHWQARDGDRPSDFDGAARIIDRDYGQVCWWQPPDDIKGDAEGIDSLLGWIRDRWDMGWSWVAIELLGPAPAMDPTDWRYVHSNYHPPRPVLGQEGIGGVDDTGSGYLATLVSDLASELAYYLRNLKGTEPVTVHQ